MAFSHIKHYHDLIWLIYRHGDMALLQHFDVPFDLPQLLKERGDERGKAEDLARDLEQLGPFYIKLGQILSAESQLLPPSYETALQKLQDRAEPMPYEDVISVIFEELGNMPENIFATFDPTPLSAASLGQVHLARLKNGKQVAVKVQRRHIQQTIIEQLEMIGHVSTFLEAHTTWGKRYHVIEKFHHLQATLLRELDYLQEASHLRTLSAHLREFDRLIVPQPILTHTTSRVLCMDFIRGKNLLDLTPSQRRHASGHLLAVHLFRAFLKQILIDGFFQMDPHPGNIYLTHRNRKPALALFDLGMVAHVPFQMQGTLLRCLFAMSEGREAEVTHLLLSLGTRLAEFDAYQFRSRIAEVIANYHGQSIDQVPLGKIVLELSHIAAASGLWLPIQFTLIGKTLLSLSAVLEALDPSLNPTAILRAEASSLLNRRLSEQLSYQSFYGSVLEGVEFLERLPSRLNQLLDVLLQNDYRVSLHFPEHQPVAKNFEKIANRIAMGIMLASLILSAAIMLRGNTFPHLAMSLLLLAGGGSFFLISTMIWTDRKKN